MRDALVGGEHEFFDQAMRDVALGARDAFHQAEFVELDDRLGKIEIDRAAALAFAVEDDARDRASVRTLAPEARNVRGRRHRLRGRR